MTGKKIKLTVVSVIALAAVVLCVVFFHRIVGIAAWIIRLFMPFIIGYLFSLLVNPLANALQKRFKLPRSVSAILVILLTVGLLGGIATWIIVKIVGEVRSIYENFPVIYVNMRYSWEQIWAKFNNIYDVLPLNAQQMLDNFSDNMFASLSELASIKPAPIFESAGNFAKGLPGIFISTIVFILSAFFMISDSKTVSHAINGMFGRKFRRLMEATKTEIKRYVGAYIKAQFIIMMCSFVILMIGLNILSVEYSLLIALATAFIDALPFFGSGAVLWTWSAISFLSSDFRRGIGLIIIYLCVIFTRQMIEPKIVSQKIGMNPILTLMSMYVGYKTLSIGGMIFGPLLLMLFISLKRAGMFDGIAEFFCSVGRVIKNEAIIIKNQFKE